MIKLYLLVKQDAIRRIFLNEASLTIWRKSFLKKKI